MADPDPMITLFALRMIQEGHTCLDPDGEGDCPICDKWETGDPVSPDPSATKKGPTVAEPATDEKVEVCRRRTDADWWNRSWLDTTLDIHSLLARIDAEVARTEKLRIALEQVCYAPTLKDATDIAREALNA